MAPVILTPNALLPLGAARFFSPYITPHLFVPLYLLFFIFDGALSLSSHTFLSWHFCCDRIFRRKNRCFEKKILLDVIKKLFVNFRFQNVFQCSIKIKQMHSSAFLFLKQWRKINNSRMRMLCLALRIKKSSHRVFPGTPGNDCCCCCVL